MERDGLRRLQNEESRGRMVKREPGSSMSSDGDTVDRTKDGGASAHKLEKKLKLAHARCARANEEREAFAKRNIQLELALCASDERCARTLLEVFACSPTLHGCQADKVLVCLIFLDLDAGMHGNVGSFTQMSGSTSPTVQRNATAQCALACRVVGTVMLRFASLPDAAGPLCFCPCALCPHARLSLCPVPCACAPVPLFPCALLQDCSGREYRAQGNAKSTVLYRGGGFSWQFDFAWELSRFKLTAKFPTRNSGFSANFWHSSGTHCGLWRVVIHSTRGLREISHSEIYHRDFDLARKFPSSCSFSSCCGSSRYRAQELTVPGSNTRYPLWTQKKPGPTQPPSMMHKRHLWALTFHTIVGLVFICGMLRRHHSSSVPSRVQGHQVGFGWGVGTPHLYFGGREVQKTCLRKNLGINPTKGYEVQKMRYSVTAESILPTVLENGHNQGQILPKIPHCILNSTIYRTMVTNNQQHTPNCVMWVCGLYTLCLRPPPRGSWRAYGLLPARPHGGQENVFPKARHVPDSKGASHVEPSEPACAPMSLCPVPLAPVPLCPCARPL